MVGFTSCQADESKAIQLCSNTSKGPLYPVVFQILWDKPTGIFMLNDPKYSLYPHEKEFILGDGKKMIVLDVQLKKAEGQGWNYTIITLKA